MNARPEFEADLADHLLRSGRLDAAGLERARRLASGQGERLDAILVKLGLIPERDLAEAISQRLELDIVESGDYPDSALLDGTVSINFLKTARVVPIEEDAHSLVLAMADPLDEYAIQAMRLLTGKSVVPRIGVPAEIESAIERLYGGTGGTIGSIAEESGVDEGDVADEDVERLKDLASEAPVIRMVNLLISRAVEARASDIHIEPFESRLRVRYRIDGVLQETEAPPNRFRAAVISRVKVMARLNIAERRLPQDGRVKIAIRGKDIDLRVSTVPTMYGESVVLRILDRSAVVLDFAALGFEGALLERFFLILDQPNGILLVTGPTGSGKTTTLYTSLLRLNSPTKKIFTVEDPIEYHLDGVNQIHVRPTIGLSFANILRSILRQDPDIIMVGEMRDLETAQIGIQAALTGHLVLSTLHTNDAPATIGRLLDMGVEDYLLTSTVNGVLAQRLVRTLCTSCREPYEAMPELIEQLRLDRFGACGRVTLYRPVGCEFCAGTGFRGRSAIAEVLVMTDRIRQAVLRHAEAREIQKAALADGMESMFANGIRAALAGATSIGEVVRVTREE